MQVAISMYGGSGWKKGEACTGSWGCIDRGRKGGITRGRVDGQGRGP